MEAAALPHGQLRIRPDGRDLLSQGLGDRLPDGQPLPLPADGRPNTLGAEPVLLGDLSRRHTEQHHPRFDLARLPAGFSVVQGCILFHRITPRGGE